MTLFEDLKWRGLIQDVSNPEIEDILNNKEVTFYWGTDPTADSLHIGHYSSLVTAKRLTKAGHHPILLVGGATGLIPLTGVPLPFLSYGGSFLVCLVVSLTIVERIAIESKNA